MTSDTILLGMDLGTFRTTVISSTGQRAELETVVGWPKDHVAAAVLGKDHLFGAEAANQQMALDLVRPFGHGLFKYNSHAELGLSENQLERYAEAARLLVQHMVSRVQPNRDSEVFGVVGVPAEATRENKEYVARICDSVFAATLLVPEPFAVAYSMDQLLSTLVVDIGAGTIDLCPMFGTLPRNEDLVTIAMGGDAIDREFYQAVLEDFPGVQFSLRLARQIKEKYGTVGKQVGPVMISLPIHGKPTDLDLGGPLSRACSAMVQPIVEAIVQLVSRYEPEIQRELLKNVILGGGGSQLRGLTDRLEEALTPYGGGNVVRAYDSVFAGAAGALKIALATPEAYWERLRAERTVHAE